MGRPGARPTRSWHSRFHGRDKAFRVILPKAVGVFVVVHLDVPEKLLLPASPPYDNELLVPVADVADVGHVVDDTRADLIRHLVLDELPDRSAEARRILVGIARNLSPDLCDRLWREPRIDLVGLEHQVHGAVDIEDLDIAL